MTITITFSKRRQMWVVVLADVDHNKVSLTSFKTWNEASVFVDSPIIRLSLVK